MNLSIRSSVPAEKTAQDCEFSGQAQTTPARFGTVLSLGKGFWDIERRRAGSNVDGIRGQNIPSNSRTIDRTIGLTGVVSHKTTDLRCKSYQSASAVYALGTSFVRSLSNYSGEVRRDRKKQATYILSWAIEGHDSTRTLEWFIPLHGIGEAQEAAIRRVVAYDESRNVAVHVFLVP